MEVEVTKTLLVSRLQLINLLLEGMMRQVRLSTPEGSYVATVRVPIFNPPPDAIMWGSRFFQHITAEHYSEGFIYVVQEMKVTVEKVPEAEKTNDEIR